MKNQDSVDSLGHVSPSAASPPSVSTHTHTAPQPKARVEGEAGAPS